MKTTTTTTTTTTTGDIIILHLCTKNYDHDVRFLIYGARHTDGQTGKVTYRGGYTTEKYVSDQCCHKQKGVALKISFSDISVKMENNFSK